MADSGNLGIDWTRLVLILLACGGMAGLLLWLRHQKAQAGHSLLEVKDRLRLGPRQQVIALRVGNQTLLLGATGERLVLLSEIQDAPDPLQEDPSSLDTDSLDLAGSLDLSASLDLVASPEPSQSPFARVLEASVAGVDEASALDASRAGAA